MSKIIETRGIETRDDSKSLAEFDRETRRKIVEDFQQICAECPLWIKKENCSKCQYSTRSI